MLHLEEHLLLTSSWLLSRRNVVPIIPDLHFPNWKSEFLHEMLATNLINTHKHTYTHTHTHTHTHTPKLIWSLLETSNIGWIHYEKMSSFYWTAIYPHWFCPLGYCRKYLTPLFHDSPSDILRQYLCPLLPTSLPIPNSASQLLHALQEEMPHEKWGWTPHCKYGLTRIHFLYSESHISINWTYNPLFVFGT